MLAKVSMVVPCYNKEDYIGSMLNSVLEQIYNKIEIIFVNDCSTDGTRKIIEDYKPKLVKRGYEVIIIDHDTNKSLAYAIKSGLLAVTGDYVCMPDCDDILDREYVLVMAEYLTNHSTIDWVICDYNHQSIDYPSNEYMRTNCESIYEKTDNEKRLKMFLLYQVNWAVWTCMIRNSYLIKCETAKRFVIESGYTQEPQVRIPLHLLNGTMGYIHQPLYFYNSNTNNSEQCAFLAKQSGAEIVADRDFKISSEVLKVYDKLTAENLFLLEIARLWYMFYKGRWANEQELLEKWINMISKEVQYLPFADQKEIILQAGFTVSYNKLCSIILKEKLGKPLMKNSGRIIAYGAFGSGARQILTGLLNSDTRPDEFWDMEAKSESSISDISVKLPNFKSIQDEDTILLLLKDVLLAKEVTELIKSHNGNAKIFYYYDVIDYLTDYFFGGDDFEEFGKF